MNDLELIRESLRRMTNRRRLAQGLAGLWKGALIGSILMLLGLGVYKLAPIPERVLGVVGICAVAAAAIGFLIGWLRPVTLMETARFVDSRKKFQERLSTALEIGESKVDAAW